MKLPASMLERLRGPLAAVALAGCSSPAPAIEPEPPAAPVAALPAPAPDPVAYDDTAESIRLAREDENVAADGTRRTRRLALARRNDGARDLGPGGIGVGHTWYGAGCGRG